MTNHNRTDAPPKRDARAPKAPGADEVDFSVLDRVYGVVSKRDARGSDAERRKSKD